MKNLTLRGIELLFIHLKSLFKYTPPPNLTGLVRYYFYITFSKSYKYQAWKTLPYAESNYCLYIWSHCFCALWNPSFLNKRGITFVSFILNIISIRNRKSCEKSIYGANVQSPSISQLGHQAFMIREMKPGKFPPCKILALSKEEEGNWFDVYLFEMDFCIHLTMIYRDKNAIFIPGMNSFRSNFGALRQFYSIW